MVTSGITDSSSHFSQTWCPIVANWSPRFKYNEDISTLDTEINVLLKHWEPITQWHNVTYQNNGYLNYTTVQTLKTENFGANDTGVILYRNKLNNLPKIKFLSRIEYKRIQMGGQRGDPCTSTVINLLHSPYVHTFSSPTLQAKCSILLTTISSKTPGFIQCRPRCLNLNL
jgi:hypothetical protein